ncbi:indole-3-glycerol phosphate synthase TrpC [Rhodohalobacter halophilus]|uniref:indole-3-glycerol phosphate synthase TrpC n=1 Tax=Rhodohalobacter halophilus TaxID=1812810 RepID=UPI00083F6FA2|nr:indole-3-glycerol phosphate synthase TrpC [Rhodohalobacter halophilus]
MVSILNRITEQTLEDLKKKRRRVSMRDFESFPRFEKPRKLMSDALSDSESVSIIAEVKKASPSKGVIRDDFDPEKIADRYIESGASAISVLTDEPFFQGSLDYLEKISDLSPIPVLRKDFILDPYQIKEARASGADAILLIATIYEGNQLSELLAATKEFGLQALVECYHEEEVESMNWDQIEILGVNNRNLNTFEVDLHRGIELLNRAPENIIKVSESGIHKREDISHLKKKGIHAALIGEHLMKQHDPGKALKELLNKEQKF